MAEFTMQEAAAALAAHPLRSTVDRVFTGISTDTRSIKPGNLFVALKGERFDGHAFLSQAVGAGASGLVVSDPAARERTDAAVFFVRDTRAAYQALARFHRQRFHIPVIAVTGSNGKTTTKDFIAAVLSEQFRVLKTEANFNNEIGLPKTLLQLTTGHQAAVVEMGMRGLGEIQQLAAVALPTVGVVTNVGDTHIELLGSVENIAQAKGELIESLPRDGFAVLNADNPYVREMGKRSPCRTIYYGIEQPADVYAENIVIGSDSTSFRCRMFQRGWEARIPAIGRHNVYNALAAIAVGAELGMPQEQIAAGLLRFAASPMRLHIEKSGDKTIINDAYNASPLSMKAAIETMAATAAGRKVAVLGDMLELGSFSEEAHRNVGRLLAEKQVDAVVTVGEQARYIADAASAGGVKIIQTCRDHSEAIAALQKMLQAGDTILVKGSRGMKMENILSAL